MLRKGGGRGREHLLFDLGFRISWMVALKELQSAAQCPGGDP